MHLVRAHWAILASVIAGVILSLGVVRMVDDLRAPDIVILDPLVDRTLVVEISGEVAVPGVYELPAGSRVADVINAAGGTLELADVASINQAARVHDSDQIVIPSTEIVLKPENGDSPQGIKAATALVNLNSASQAELESLPGIGPVLAGRIIQARTEHGGFSSLEEIVEIDGISQSTIDKIRPLVTIDK